MNETTARLGLPCPACSPEGETVHEVLSDGGHATVRCIDCGHVHKTELPETRTLERKLVVSQEGESFSDTVAVPAGERLAVGEEFLHETEEAIFTVRITSLELDAGRADAAAVEEVRTIWGRAVGNVSVNVTAHPKSGAHDETHSFAVTVPGDYEFTVGESETLADEEFTVNGIFLRGDATGYEFEQLDHEGDSALAKDVKRLYARDESTSAWSAW